MTYKQIIYLLLFFTTEVVAIEFDVIPSEFNAKGVKVIFSYPDSINGAVATKVSFKLNSQIKPDNVLKHYKNLLNSGWVMCPVKPQDGFADYQNNHYKSEGRILTANNKRQLIAVIQIGRDVKTNERHVFVVQYNYKNQKQYNRDANASKCIKT